MVENKTLRAFIENTKELKASIEVFGIKGIKGDQGLSGDQPQPWATISTAIPANHYWIKASLRLALGQTVSIASDAKLIVI